MVSVTPSLLSGVMLGITVAMFRGLPQCVHRGIGLRQAPVGRPGSLRRSS